LISIGTIYQFKLICDNTNNTPKTIDENSVVLDAYWTEIYGQEIENHVKLIATSRGVSFTELNN